MSLIDLFKKKSKKIVLGEDANIDIKFIYDMFNDLIDNRFKCNRSSMIQDGNIFYFNGNSGTKFDWSMNNHVSTLATLYTDNTEAVKVHIYNDGTVIAYYYNKGSKMPDDTVNTKISVETARAIAATLFILSDCKGIFNKTLNSLDYKYKMTDDDFLKFDDENYFG